MKLDGLITKGVGGLYTVLTIPAAPGLDTLPDAAEGITYLCRARGHFRYKGISPTVGDNVTVLIGEDANTADTADSNEKKPRPHQRKTEKDVDGVIDEIRGRRNLLIRPPMANLDMMFAVIPTCRPAPDLGSVDKMLSIAEHADINAAVIITKCELDRDAADAVADIYRRAGYEVFPVSSYTGEGVDALRDFIAGLGTGSHVITAFAGASGAGKSTLLNRLYPSLSLGTGELSRKISRGRQTTRHVELYPAGSGVFVADTPGFSLLDFERFDFFSVEALPFTFREFEPYHGKCRYTKCTHIREDGCAIIEAVDSGVIPRERHESYRALYDILKDKHPWDK